MQQTSFGVLRTLGASLAAVALLGAPSVGAQTTFEWLQGGNFEQLQFVDSSHGFLTGDGGRLHATADGGLTWEEVTTDNINPEAWGNVHGMHFRGTWGTSSFKGWAAASNGVVLRTTDTEGLIWEYANPDYRVMSTLATEPDKSDCGTHYALLRDIYMLDDDNGVVVGDDGAYATTTDGGATWTSGLYFLGSGNAFDCSADPNDIYQIHFFSQSGPGFASNARGIMASEYGRVVKSDDGGVIWYTQAVHARGLTTGTCDGSEAIPPLEIGHSQSGDNLELWEIAFEDPTDSETAMTVVGGVGNDNGYVFRHPGGWTLDPCTAWSQERNYNFVTPFKPLHSTICGMETLYTVDLLNSSSGLAELVTAGYGGALHTRDSNAEINFESLHSSLPFIDPPDCHGLNCDPPNTCPTGAAWVQHTTVADDAFGNPLPLPFGNTAALLAGARVDDEVAVFAGHFGRIARLDLGATAPDIVNEVGAPWAQRILDGWFVDEDDGFLVGQLGFVLRTVDGGTTWTQPTIDWTLPSSGVAEDVAALTAISFSDSGQYGVLVGTGGHIARTSDYGANWTTINLSALSHTLINTTLNDVAYVKGTVNTFYAVGASGRVILSEDGGATWVDKHLATPVNLNAVAFAPPSPITNPPTPPTVGYVVGGRVFRTTNGGASWSTPAVSDGGASPYYDVATWGSGSDAVLVGTGGKVFERSGGAFNEITATSFTNLGIKEDLYDVEALSSGAYLRISGDNGVVLFRDNGVWTRPRSRTTQQLFKMAFRTPDEGIGFGRRSLLIKYDDT